MSDIRSVFEKIKNKFLNSRNRKAKRAKTTIDDYALNRAISKDKFLKNIRFDITEKEFKEYSDQDVSFYNKIINKEGLIIH